MFFILSGIKAYAEAEMGRKDTNDAYRDAMRALSDAIAAVLRFH